MVKGKAWTVEEERRLRELVKAGATVAKIAALLGKTEASVRSKIQRLKLKVEDDDGLKFNMSSSSNLDAEGELQSVEEALKLLNGALNALKTRGLDKTETHRLRIIIQAHGSTWTCSLTTSTASRLRRNSLIWSGGRGRYLSKKNIEENQMGIEMTAA